jgi:hypothetical protein
MMTFWEWVSDASLPHVPACRNWLGHGDKGKHCVQCLIVEGDEGYKAFIDQTNREFRRMIATLLRMGKFTDPRNEAEARAIVADPHYFDYAQELLAAAAGGRSRLRGQDVLDGAQEANVVLWRTLLDPRLYEPEGVTWETKNPHSAGRSGLRGSIRSWGRHAAAHYSTRLHKRRARVTTHQASQIVDPRQTFDPPARTQMSDFEWYDLKRAIVNDLETQLNKEVEGQGPHWQSRARNLRWAIEVVRRQMAVPWEWRSMPDAAAEMPELNGKLRGGLADQLKLIIDKARRKGLGECRQWRAVSV